MANRITKPDPHFLHYLQKRDAMVARAVTNRLKQRFMTTENRTRKFFSMFTTSRIPRPPLNASLEPGKVTSTAIFISYVSISTLVREHPPVITTRLKPVRQVKARRVFKEKTVSPPSSRTRSKNKNKSSETTAPTPTPTPDHKANKIRNKNKALTPTHQSTTQLASTDHKPEDGFMEFAKSQNKKLCNFHICNKQHKCPKAPPWPALCSSCDKPCLFRARVCGGCGNTLCFDHELYVGICTLSLNDS